jgi:hypothetical protein
MPDYQRIVDDLYGALGNGETITPEASALLESYREACQKANDRLRQCEAMLRQGLRGEAIQLAEIEPNLLETVATLHFPGRDRINSVLQRHGLSLAPLIADAAADLNEAYAMQRPLEGLLNRHRFLALSMAPLKERLDTLRKIAAADELNPVWNDDIECFETERIKEIQVEANRAVSERDLSTLEALAAEMKGSWLYLSSGAAAQKLAKAAGEVRTSLAKDDLGRLERELNLAHASLDLERGRALRTQWKNASSICKLSASDPIRLQAAPALEWLAERDAREAAEAAFQRSLAALELALDRPVATSQTDHAQLQSLYAAAQRHGNDLPPSMEERYRSHVKQFSILVSHRKMRRVLTAVAVTLLLVGGGAFAVAQRIQQGRIDDAVLAFSDLLEQAKQDPSRQAGAEAFLAKLSEANPTIAQAPRIRRLATELQANGTKEQARARDFQAALSQARSEGARHPNQEALATAARLARLGDEKGAVASFEAEIASTARAVQSEIDREFASDLQQLSARLAELERSDFRDLEKLAAAIGIAEADGETLRSKHKNVSDSTSSQIDPLMKRLIALKATGVRLRGESGALQAITKSIGDYEAYVAALKRFVESYPDGGRGDDFKRVLSESSHWARVELWNKEDIATLQACKDGSMATQSSAMIERIKASVKTLERFPNTESMLVRAEILADMSGRTDENGLSTLLALEKAFGHSMLTKVWLLTMKGRGERYYLDAELTIGTSESQGFQVIEDFGRTRQLFKNPNDFDKIVKAPHCIMATAMLSELSQMKQAKPEGWEQGMVRMFQSIHNANDAEPVLRLGVLKRTLEVGCRGSGSLRRALEHEHRLLQGIQTNLLVNWMRPLEDDAKLAAESASKELKNFADLPAHAAAALVDAKATREKAFRQTQYRWYGRLSNDGRDGWQCVANNQASPSLDGRLVVMTPNAPSGPIMQTIGRMNQGAVELQSSDRTLLIDGRPVWIETISTP